MVAPQADNEQVRYDIIIEAKAALESLREMMKLTTSNQEKVIVFSRTVLEQSKAMGIAWQQLLGVYKELNAELSQQHKATIFGNTGGKDLMGQSQQYLQSLQDTGRLEEEVAQKSTKVGSAGESAFNRVFSSVNALRIALGAIISMILFQVIQAFQQFFSGAIKNAQELEAALYRIHNAERILSQEGIDVSVKGLEDGIKRIKALLPIFSKEDITGLVGQVAIATKSLKLNEDQIVSLSQAIAVMNVNSAENEDLQSTAQKVISSLLTNNAKGVANLGLKLGDAAIQAEAMSEGLLKAGESVSKLSDQEKSIVKVNLAIKAGADSIAGLNEYLDSNTGRLQQNKAAWEDLKTTVGQALLPFLPTLTALFSALTDSVNFLKASLVIVLTLINSFVGVWILFSQGGIKSFKDLTNALHYFGEELKKTFAKKFFPEGLPQNAPKWLKDWIGKDLTPAETPTSNVPGATESTANDNKAKAVSEAESKIQDIMQESADKKAQIELDYGRKLEDISRNYSQKLEDIARDTAQKREDALRAYNQKVEDINRNADEEERRAKEDSRQKEIDREKEYQQKLKELREKFLMDLEDALRERDARQVLRLIRQYNMDKQNLADRKKLDEAQAKRDLAFKLKQIEQDRQLKLAAAKREYDDKLQEIAIGEQRALDEAKIWQQRQLQDANIWHQRQLQEYRQYLQQKLRDLANALVKEYQLTAAGAAAIYQLLGQYFGSGGSISQLLGTALTNSVSGILGGGGSGGSGSFPIFTPNGGGGGGAFPVFTPNGYAEGGTLIATRPTKALFGEDGPERVDITPLNRPGNNVGRVFGDKSALGMGGNVKIRLELSPDLEARIVESSLDSVALTLEKVAREK